MMIVMRRRQGLVSALVVGLAGLAGLGGCSGDTEILIHVTRDPAAPATIPELRIYAAVASGQKMGDAAVYVDESDAKADVDVSARDLATDPYVLALRPGSQLPGAADLQVAALGFQLDTDGAPRAIAFGLIDHTIRFAGGQVLSWDLALGKLDNAAVTASGLGCIDFVIGDQKIHIGAHDDWDCDGDPHGTDCNDLDPAVNHMATEVCGNPIDEDCSGAIDDDTDADHDGISACGGDCIDNPTATLPAGLTAADVHPGAVERPDNAIDENCDGVCAVAAAIDSDQDHYTTTGIKTDGAIAGRCLRSTKLTDCDDTAADINPGQTENVTNGIDDDCDGHCDVDLDGDGYTPSGYLDMPVMAHCPAIDNGRVDCDDDPANDPATGPKAIDIHPGATEICDGIDEDCDGTCDDDVDADGYSACGTVTQDPTQCVVVAGTCAAGEQCDCAPGASVAHPVPANGTPVPERCDGYDENCDGVPYPKDNPCFAAGPSLGSCYAGTRACKDDDAVTPWDVCKTDMQQPVDPALCTAYDVCFADPTVIDPFACAVGKATLGTIACTEHVTSGTTACVPDQYILQQLVSSGTCAGAQWQVAGGTTHGPWTVAFVDAGGGTSDKATGCTATFEVTAFDHNLSTGTTTSMLITQSLGAEAVSVILTLSAASATVCPGSDGNLTCSGP